MENKNYTLLSLPLESYTIVYTTSDNADCNKKSADHLSAILSEKTGVSLPVVADSDACDCVNKFILGTDILGVDKPEIMNYVLKVTDEGCALCGGGLLSVYMGVCKFVEKYVTDSDVIEFPEGTYSLLKVKDEPLAEGAEFRAMTFNIMAQWPNWGGDYMPVVQRFESFKAIIDGYSPDVAGVQEVSDHWSDMILDVYGDTYEFVNRITPDGLFVNLSTIIYKKAKFDLVDSGLQYFSYNGPNKIRLVDWAILKDKKTSKQFAFFNTHWMFTKDPDTEREAHSVENAVIIKQVLADHPGVKHAFSTADFNTRLDHPYIINFLKNAGLVNSLDVAKESGHLINEVGGCSKPGVCRESYVGGGSIDNVFVTPTMQVLRHETILWNGIEHVSDHSPKYADVVLDD